MALDTRCAGGQCRYVESLSAYARQFAQLMEKPDVALIEGLSPAISMLESSVAHYAIDTNVPFERLPVETSNIVLYGSGLTRVMYVLEAPVGAGGPAVLDINWVRLRQIIHIDPLVSEPRRPDHDNDPGRIARCDRAGGTRCGTADDTGAGASAQRRPAPQGSSGHANSIRASPLFRSFPLLFR